MKIGKKLMVAGFSLILPLTGYSQEQEEKKTPIMETVVVTATKTKERVQDVPNAVIVLDSGDIEESSPQSVGELVADEPGIDWRTYGNYGGAAQTIKVRGMRDTEVQVLLNGISVNSPSLGMADVGALPVDSIDRVEIVKGAGSFLYGSGAMAGTVNILTKDPQPERMDLILKGSYGSFNTQAISVEQGQFLTEELGYYLTLHQKKTDGERSNSDLTQQDGSLKVVFDLGDTLKLSFYGYQVDREFGKPGILPPEGTNSYLLNGVELYNGEAASLVDRGKTIDQYAVLEAESQLSESMKIRVKKYLSDMDSIDKGWTIASGTGEKTQVVNTIDGSEANLEIDALGSRFLIGVDAKSHDWRTSKAYLDIHGAETGNGTPADQTIASSGIFSQAQFSLGQTIKLLAGARQENHSTFGSEILPHGGIVFNVSESTTLKLTHGKHFKSPTPNDLFWPEDDYVRGNPGLKPQTGWHSDLTLEQGTSNDPLNLSLSFFQWNVKDKIEWAENPDYPSPSPYYANKWTPTNLDVSNGLGMEVGCRYNPSYNLGLSVGYTYTTAEDEIEAVKREAQFSPQHRLKAGVVYRSSIGLTAQTTLRYVSERKYFRARTDESPTDVLNAYTLMDLTVQQRFQENWLVSFRAGNLLDEKYDTFVGNYFDENFSAIYGNYPGSSRNLTLQVSYIY